MALEKYKLNTAEDGSVGLLQVTDMHLFADHNTELLGVNTSESFMAVVDEAANEGIPYDYVLATGDLSQDHTARSYQRFAETVARLEKPCFWLPGNHDEKVAMSSLDNFGLLSAKQLVSEHWQVIMLDTQVAGKPHGMLSEQQLDELEQALQEYPDKYVLIAMHHQAVPVGCQWLDQHDIKNADAFFERVAPYRNIRGVVFGHVHQNFEYHHNGIALIATPSTCIQFLPLSAHFALDHQQPGWRYLRLNQDGTISTRLRRLADQSFLPDPRSKGY